MFWIKIGFKRLEDDWFRHKLPSLFRAKSAFIDMMSIAVDKGWYRLLKGRLLPPRFARGKGRTERSSH